MGIFDIFSGSGGSNVLAVGGQLVGAAIGAFANKSAADSVADSSRDAIAAANGQFKLRQEIFAPVAEQFARGLSVVSAEAARDPYERTPSQRAARGEFTRDLQERMATGPLAGSGRAEVAVFNRGIRDFDNRQVDINRSQRDAAASRLFEAGRSAISATATGVPDHTNNIQRAGNAEAGATAANGALIGQTLGTLAASLARNDSTDDEPKQTNPGGR